MYVFKADRYKCKASKVYENVVEGRKVKDVLYPLAMCDIQWLLCNSEKLKLDIDYTQKHDTQDVAQVQDNVIYSHLSGTLTFDADAM